METPEKIYVHVKKDKITNTWNSTWIGVYDVEYVRKDAFIEKMAIWFNNNFMVHDEYGVISDSFNTEEEMFEDFKNYIK